MNLRKKIEFPVLKDLLELEKNTLKSMLIIRKIYECHPLVTSIRQALGTFEKKNKYNFHCILNISNDTNLNKREAAIAIGAETKVSEENKVECISYSTSLILKDKGMEDTYCKKYCFALNNNVKPRIIRRFHFDYDAFGHEDHPIFHLQYGGKPEDPLKAKHYCLEGWLETPRIFFVPMTLSLLFDLIIREYNTVLDKELLSCSEWIKIIRNSENIILKPYFDVCHEYFEKSVTRESSSSFVHWHYG